MPLYSYTGINISGKKVKGKLEAPSKSMAQSTLDMQNIAVITLQDYKESYFNIFKKRRSPPMTVWIMAIRQLSALLQGGIPLGKALEISITSTKNSALKSILENVKSHIEEGLSLSVALKKAGGCPPLLPSIIEGGESVGNLPAVLDQIASYWGRINIARNKVMSSLLYPFILTLVSILVIGILMGHVVPTVVAQITAHAQTLPTITLVVLTIGTFVKSYWWALALTVVTIIAYVQYRYRDNSWRYGFDKKLLQAPFIGNILRTLYTASFARTLSVLLSGGVTMIEALRITEKSINNYYVQQEIKTARYAIAKGVQIASAFQNIDGMLPLLTYMTLGGQQHGDIAGALQQCADTVEPDLENALHRITTVIEPLLILTMGAIVFTVIIAMLMPIMQLNALAGDFLQ